MSTGEGELGRTVIKRRRFPHICRVTGLANMAESSCHVIWIRRLCEICGVTRVAIGVHQFVVAIDMAQLTWRRDVSTGERELRRTVIERRRFPNICRVTRLASVIQHSCDMIRVGRSGIISGMAWIAVCIRELVVAVNVT